MKPIHEMTFPEFVEAVRPTAGINRWPQFGGAKEVVSYTVYMNGEVGARLPSAAQEHEFKDVALHALTEKLGLDPHARRDNLKVAEILAVRHAYMAAVLEASMVQPLPALVEAEYARLTDKMSHPYIREAIESQKSLKHLAATALADAERRLGHPVMEKPAAGVQRGTIVSQNQFFTAQETADGNVVLHENRRLAELPAADQEVTVTYYRGQGQVVANMRDMRLGVPYVEAESGDLAVQLFDATGRAQQLVKFNSVALVAEFAEQHDIDKAFVVQAMDAREAEPKRRVRSPQREMVGLPYVDVSSELLAVRYREGSVPYTALFRSAEEFEARALTFGAGKEAVEWAYKIELHSSKAMLELETRSLLNAREQSKGEISEWGPVILDAGRRYTGKIVRETELHVVQDVGKGTGVVHDKWRLDKVPMIGERVAVTYKEGRGEVGMREVSKDRGR